MGIGDYPDLRLRARLFGSGNEIRKLQENVNFTPDRYLLWGGSFGAEYRLAGAASDYLLTRGSLVGEVGGNLIAGGPDNRGSKRIEPEILVGWKQYLFTYQDAHLFVMPQIGVGLGFNQMNFGRGDERDWERSWTGQVQGTAGLEACFTPAICLAVGGGYFAERTFAGEPGYVNRGFLVTLEPSLSPSVVIVERRAEPPDPPPFFPPSISRKWEKPPEAERPACVPLPEEMIDIPIREYLEIPFLFTEEDQIPSSNGKTVREGGRNAVLDLIGDYLKKNPMVKIRLKGHYPSSETTVERQARIESVGSGNKAVPEPSDEPTVRKRSFALAYLVKDYLEKRIPLPPGRDQVEISGNLLCKNGDEVLHLCDPREKEQEIVDAAGESVLGSTSPLYPEEKRDPSDPRNRFVLFEVIR